MLDPTTLFSYDRDIETRALRATTMLVTLDAFTDAGHAQRLVDEHLLGSLPHREIGRLDLDAVFDYGAHRPEITLDRDRFVDYAQPQIVLHELTAPSGEPFYLLTGPEPTLQWERVAASLRIVVEQLGITRTLLAQGFPAPAPHTRPLAVTLYADDPARLQSPRPLPATFRMRSTFTALLAVRLGQAGYATVGLVAHVPQYLHEMPYPDAAIALLRAVETESGLTLPVGALAPAARTARESVEKQVAEAAPLQELIRALESEHDRSLATAADDGSASGVAADTSALPSAEEIADEVERFLRDIDEGGDAPS